jgi:hypothetical protein
MDIKSVLMDIVKHTSGLGIIDNVKIIGTEEGTTIAAMDSNKTVILTGKMHEAVPEFVGEFGMGNLGLLTSMMRLSNYQDTNATIDVIRQVKDEVELPVNLVFKDAEGGKDQYRFMSRDVIDQAMKVATFKGASWDVQVAPVTKRIMQLSEVAGIYSGVDPAFSVKTEDGNLVFTVGSNEGGATGRRVFAENIEGTLSTTWSWPLSQFLSIIKLGGTITVRFSNQGVCQIDVDSGLGVYSYIMPALSN